MIAADSELMTITIEIPKEVQDKLVAQAQARGIDISVYAATLLEQAAQSTQPDSASHDVAEFEKTLDRMAQFSHKIPVLPDEAFSRENLYSDHD